MASVTPLLAKIQKAHDSKADFVKRLIKAQKALKKAGIDYGTPTYKNKKYMRIVRPAANGEPRQFDYVGADPEKQEAALAALERGRKYDELTEKISELEQEIAAIKYSLNRIIAVL